MHLTCLVPDRKPAGAGPEWKKLTPSKKWSPSACGCAVTDEIRVCTTIMLLTALSYFIIQVGEVRISRQPATNEDLRLTGTHMPPIWL